MRRSRILTAVVVIVLFAGGGWLLGQEKDKPDKVKGQLPPNWGKLGLSEDQKQQVYKTKANYKTKKDELKKKLEELEDKENEELLKVLTDNQKAQLKKILTDKLDPPKDKDKPKDK